MGCISPGGTELMANMVGRLNLAEGSRILEVGCGEGDTLARIASDYGFDCMGIDKSKELIRRGLAKHPALDLRVVNEPYTSADHDEIKPPYNTAQPFDAIIMECVLSVSGDPKKNLQSYANALKPKGYLLISDLCERNQKPDALIESARKLGLKMLTLEDRTADLDSFAIEKIMEYGSLKKYYEATLPQDADHCDFFPAYGDPAKNKTQSHAPGYFLAVFCRLSNPHPNSLSASA
jgi:ubiquinone/menaquinone biosynthesis C-methylase UbiE